VAAIDDNNNSRTFHQPQKEITPQWLMDAMINEPNTE
jgi:hypothetical protein